MDTIFNSCYLTKCKTILTKSWLLITDLVFIIRVVQLANVGAAHVVALLLLLNEFNVLLTIFPCGYYFAVDTPIFIPEGFKSFFDK